MTYSAPLEDMLFVLQDLCGLEDIAQLPGLEEAEPDMVAAILEEAGKFAGQVLAPLNASGDQQGLGFEGGNVTTPEGWQDAYTQIVEMGWNSPTADPEHGGMGLPQAVNACIQEMFQGANMSFQLCPMLTQGAIEAIEGYASEELQQAYLPNLVTGAWTGTMNLTEPQAGSDLSLVKTRAKRADDGTYLIKGLKIFITYGEHDMTENICHLVLARLPDAPAGTRGISLFLVPKFLVNADGSLGERNDVFCQSIEHKLGIHGSPTCVMIYGDGKHGDEPGAIGQLIGEENRGLACMFTMMNNARLNVGIQGVAIGEAAYQHALAYAHERRQGKAPDYSGDGMSPIVEHPDVARNLLAMKAMVQAARGICYSCAYAQDMARQTEGDEAKQWAERNSLLTPVAKAFSTDIGCEAATLGVQVHGGMGFIEETGAAQFMRDGRINPIYEGTNGIQAIDLVTRKLPLSGGDTIKAYIAELRDIADAVRGSNQAGFGKTAEMLEGAIDALEEATGWVLANLAEGKQTQVLAGATPYLRLFGLAAGGSYLAKSALGEDGSKRATLARFFAENELPGCEAITATVTGGADALIEAQSLLQEA